jgi:GTP-binding protein EngB required for normal cell division
MPTPGRLNESHQRRLLANAQYADRLLADIEGILNSAESKSAFPKYRPDVSIHQTRQIRIHIARFREHLSRVLDALGVHRETAQFGSLHSIGVTLAFVRIAVQELAPEYLQGYGGLSSATVSELRGVCTELESLINSMERSLSMGEAVDLQARLDRLEQTPGESGLLRLLDRITSEHDLAEFRAPMLNLVERLESPRFEVAVFGRVSSGKSSLLNRLLDTQVLPVGVNPITAVPVRIQYSEEASFAVTFVDRQTHRHPAEDLWRYASEEQNPGNELGVVRLVLRLPSPRLQDGLVLVDTPGLGALAAAGAAETLAYLPQCDFGLVLVSAASPINQEDMDTIHALAEAAIPAMVLLSKADLLSEADRRKAEEYTAGQVFQHLRLKVDVHPVSTVPSSLELLENWFRDQLAPLLERQHDLAKQSVRRKAGALREAVIKALQAKAGSSDGQAGTSAAFEEAERTLRAAAASIEEVRRWCLDETDAMRSFHQTALKLAVAQIAGENGYSAPHLPPTAAIQEAAAAAAVKSAAKLASQLTGLAERLQEAISKAANVLGDTQVPQEDWLTSCVREQPRFELVLPEVEIHRPWFLPAGTLAGRWVSGRIPAPVRTQLEAASVNFSRSLAAWSARTLSELQSRFEERADVYRAQLGRWIGQKRLSPEELARVERDRLDLENWTGG